MRFKLNQEVYISERFIFGKIIHEGKECVIKDNESGNNYTVLEESVVPVDYSLLLENEHNLLTYTMAGRIPGKIIVNKKDKLIVAIGDNERSVPHFHVFRNDNDLRTWNNGACIMFTDNRYFDHGIRNTETLTKAEIKALVTKLKAKHDRYNVTNWQYIKDLWNDNNENYKIPDDLEMPKYNYDTIKRYRED